jgi:hypothetical protein
MAPVIFANHAASLVDSISGSVEKYFTRSRGIAHRLEQSF